MDGTCMKAVGGTCIVRLDITMLYIFHLHSKCRSCQVLAILSGYEPSPDYILRDHMVPSV